MNITSVKVYPYDNGATKGFASITFDDCFVVTGLTIIEGKNGLFVSMPSKKVKEEYKDICFPLNKEFRQDIQDAVLKEYGGEQKDDEFYPIDDEDSDSLPF